MVQQPLTRAEVRPGFGIETGEDRSSYLSEVAWPVFLSTPRWLDNDLRFKDSRHWYPLRKWTKELKVESEDRMENVQHIKQ